MSGPVVVAAVLDVVLREPPATWHPVVWMGRYLRLAERIVPSSPHGTARVAGGLAWGVGAALVWMLTRLVDAWAVQLPHPAGQIVRGTGLWTLVSGRMLLEEGRAVEAAIARDLDAGRTAVGRIVSRDTRELDAAQVRMAAIESLAENTSDSVVAPLLWFRLGGLPAAAVYRYVNTVDASWGRRDDRWRWAGTVAARADDSANLLPARLTGAAIAAGEVPLRRLRVEAARTLSPNAGWPIAAAALRLGVRLHKRDTYALNPSGRAPEPADTVRALRVAATVMAVAAIVAAVEGGGR